jgi:hypothetical protein
MNKLEFFENKESTSLEEIKWTIKNVQIYNQKEVYNSLLEIKNKATKYQEEAVECMAAIPKTIKEASDNCSKEILSSLETKTLLIGNMLSKEENTINALTEMMRNIPSMEIILREFSTITLTSLEEISSITKNLDTTTNMNQRNLVKWEEELNTDIRHLQESIMLIPQIIQNTINAMQISSSIAEQIPIMNNLLNILINWSEISKKENETLVVGEKKILMS